MKKIEKMNKHVLWFILGIFMLGCTPSNKYEVVYKSETLRILKLTDHVYLHESYLETKDFGKVPCNGMIYAHETEAAVYDTPIDSASSVELIHWIENTLNKEIIAVVPTHYHQDNLGGLQAFHAREIPSLAYRQTIHIATEQNMPIPQMAFDPKLEITVNEIPMFIEFLGEGHTVDNTVVYIPSEKVLFGGCLIKAKGYDKGNLAEANEDAWAETVRQVKATYPDIEIVIPGHGNAGDADLLDYTIELFEKK